MCDQNIINEIDKILDKNKLYLNHQSSSSNQINSDFRINAFNKIDIPKINNNGFRNIASYPLVTSNSEKYSNNTVEDNLNLIAQNESRDKIFDLFMSQKNYFEIERKKIEGILSEQKREKEEEKNKSRELENEIHTLNKELKEMEKENFELKKELVNQEDQTKNQDLKIKELENRILDLSKSNDILNSQISGLKGMLNTSEELNNKQKSEYEDRIDKLNEEFATLKSEYQGFSLKVKTKKTIDRKSVV